MNISISNFFFANIAEAIKFHERTLESVSLPRVMPTDLVGKILIQD